MDDYEIDHDMIRPYLIGLMRQYARTQDQAMTSTKLSEFLLTVHKLRTDPGTVDCILNGCYFGPKTYYVARYKGRSDWLWWYDAAGETHTARQAEQKKDQVITSIQSLRQPPEFPDATLHAHRLRSLADAEVIEPVISDWLGELADLVEAAGA